MKPIAFIGGAYESRSIPADAQRCMNLFQELDKEGGVAAVLYGTPGTVLQYTLATGPVRGAHVMRGRAFFVGGNVLYETTSGAPVTIGNIVTISGPVSMADNGTQMVLVDGSFGYVLTGTTLALIIDPDFPHGVKKVDFQGQYFIVGVDGTQKFYISDLGDGSKWNGLEFASAESKPELLVSLIVSHDRLMLLSEKGSEQWVNTGNSEFPFERDNGSTVAVGCEASESVVEMNNGLYWLGRDKDGGGVVFGWQGGTPQRISTHPMEKAIQGYGMRSDAYALSYQQDGHTFYALTFPSVEKTWCFNAATGKWHERGYWNSDDGKFTRWRPNCHLYAGKHYVGDYENGNVYALDMDAYRDNGATIRRVRTTAPSKANLGRQRFSMFELDCETGVSDTAQDAQVMLRYSEDGGLTWSNERMQSLGRIGRTKQRVRFPRCGSGRNRVWEVAITDAVKVALYGAYVDAKASP